MASGTTMTTKIEKIKGESMNENLTDITILRDRSGSMNICRGDVIGGLKRVYPEAKGRAWTLCIISDRL